MDMMSTIHQLIRIGYSLEDINQMDLYEMDMYVIVTMSHNERRANEE